MPYIDQDVREAIEAGAVPGTTGELNFTITRLLLNYLRAHGLSYATVNELIGVLECAKLELYRRVAVPYEDNKNELNGDVYPPHRRIGKIG